MNAVFVGLVGDEKLQLLNNILVGETLLLVVHAPLLREHPHPRACLTVIKVDNLSVVHKFTLPHLVVVRRNLA